MDNLTIEQKNSLIAVYMGGILKKNNFSGSEYFLKLPFAHHAYVNSLPYADDYNELLPVVKKIMDNINKNAVNKEWHIHVDAIFLALAICYEDITPLYNATVAAIIFINQLNQQSNETSLA
jgi:hypothetical protein